MRGLPLFSEYWFLFLWIFVALDLGGPNQGKSEDLPEPLLALVPESWMTETAEPGLPWWSLLDPGGTLGDLVTESLSKNVDTVSAKWSTEQAEARLMRSRAGLKPTVSADFSSSWGPAKDALDSQPSGSSSGKLNAVIPLDPWSSLPGVSASQADARSAKALEQKTRARIAIQTASLWLEISLADATLDLVESQLVRDTELLKLVSSRFRTGGATTLDVLQQQQQLAGTKATLPAAKVRVLVSRRDLASLMGKLHLGDEHKYTIPTIPGPLAFPSPMAVVPSMPAVRIALETLISAEHSTLGAKRDFAPSLSGKASAGWNVVDLSDPSFDETWSLGLNLSVPLFSAGRNKAGLIEARSQTYSANCSLEQSIIDAIFSVENALVVEGQRREELAATVEQERAAHAATEAALRQYEKGLSTWTPVLTSLATEQQIQSALLNARRAHVNAWLDVQLQSSGNWLKDLEVK